MDIEKAIKTALEYEIRIRDLYLEAVDSTAAEAGKKIFQTLADDEQRHVDYLNYNSSWIMSAKPAAGLGLTNSTWRKAIPPVDGSQYHPID